MSRKNRAGGRCLFYDVRMHMLGQGDSFDLIARVPRQMKGRAAERLPEKEAQEEEKTAA